MDKKETIRRMREAGLKITPQRKAIIEVISEMRLLHPPVNAIHAEARKKMPNLSLSTTYATINEMRRLNLINVLDFGKKESRCETNPSEHLNLICRGCGKVLDYKMPFAIDREYIANQTGFVITGSRLEYYGFCKECFDQNKDYASLLTLAKGD
ncbi:MAG: transcriptional repressor [Deltaproteobacteria bacterium]|nr:transcriptional repressor [Deltaproteobacteria bacterium]